ncbi:hypothetical protein FNV43_RR14205 [Rhamnella rubrinervis]|uniref:C2H2-type domain-containing protein n=1 Tax=Rhamnella rubrinervis TaxID=2594499 RepID=A0A8K0H2M0_9ROSA|nr:hypothetical protein FNV43_RR14205 [Rhamnella rubrinervis]
MVFDAEEEWSNEDAEMGVQMGRSSLPLHVAFPAILLCFFHFTFNANSSGPSLVNSDVFESELDKRQKTWGQDNEESTTSRTLKQGHGDAFEVHCSRERSRAAWKIIEEYLMPFVDKERYQLSRRCRLHPDNDLYRDQEQHKIRVDINEWKCEYCKKSFYEETYLDKHFDNRHYNLLNVSHSRCLADVCGALHCNLMMDIPHKTKCNPAAAARNHHLCESLANSCFPVNEGPSASRLHEFFLRQFCDAHTCTGNQKPFARGRKGAVRFLNSYLGLQTCKEDEHILHYRVPFNYTAAAAILCIHLLVSEGDEKGNPKTDAGLTKWKEEKAVLVNRHPIS